MKTGQSSVEAAQFWPAAERSGQVPVRSPHGVAATRHGVLQPAIDQSPRVLAQRRVLQTVFGGAFQHRAETLPPGGFDGAQVQFAGEASESSRSSDALPQAAVAPVDGTGVPNQLKIGIEALSGTDVSNVRVHRNSIKPAQLNALAYAQGDEVKT